MAPQKTHKVSKAPFSKHFFSEPTLSLVEAPVLAPGEVEIDQAQIAQMQQELDAAQNMEIPDDDDF